MITRRVCTCGLPRSAHLGTDPAAAAIAQALAGCDGYRPARRWWPWS